MMRCFCAITPPDDWREWLELIRFPAAGVRWLQDENLHLTLCFLGEIDERQIEELNLSILRLRRPAFNLRPGQMGVFGSSRRARSAHLRVQNCEALTQLHKSVTRRAVDANIAISARRFVPHITLLRCKTSMGSSLQRLMQVQAPEQLSWAVTSFTLFRSHLGKSGAQYESLAHYGLGDGG